MNNESMGNVPENTGQNPHQSRQADAQSPLPPLPQPGTQQPQGWNQAQPAGAQYGQPQPQYGHAETHPVTEVLPPLPETNQLQDRTAKRRRRNGWIVGISAAVVVILALGAWGVLALTSRSGADSPQAAAEKLLRSAAEFDVVTVSQMVAPSELGVVSGPAQEVMKSGGGGNPDADIPGVQSALQELNAAGSSRLENFQTDNTDIADGVVAMHVQSGELVIEGDSERYQQALNDLQTAMAYESALLEGANEDEAVRRAKEDVAPVTDLTLPKTIDLTELNETPTMGMDMKLSLVAVQERGRWYISPVMSMIETINVSSGNPVKHGNEVLPAKPAKTPEEAGMQFVDNLVSDVIGLSQGSGTLDGTIGSLALPERRVLSIFVLPMLEQALGSGGGFGGRLPQVTLSGEFERVSGLGEVMVLPKNVKVSVGGQTQVTLTGTCAQLAMGGQKSCLSDTVPGFKALGLDKLGLVTVKEDGGYVVSIYDTVRVWAQTAGENYLKLRDAGELDKLNG